MNYIDKLTNQVKEEKNITAINYMWFVKQYLKNDKTLHCFVEGKDDISFYRNFIDRYYHDYKHLYYFCNGINNVHSQYDEIEINSKKWTIYNKHRVLFFIDKDIEDLTNEKRYLTKKNKANFFITKLYSIENYLINDYIFERMLIELFKIYDYGIINKLKEKFKTQYDNFNFLMLPLLAIIVYNKKKKNKLNLSAIELSKFLKIDQFEIKKNESNKLKQKYKKLSNYFNKVGNLEIPKWNIIRQEIRDLTKIGNEKIYFRGHYQIFILDVFVKKINNFLEKERLEIEKINKKRKSKHLKKLPTYPKFEKQGGDLLELLAPRVKIPNELQLFLKHNYNKVQ